jgi:hypothetical protein
VPPVLHCGIVIFSLLPQVRQTLELAVGRIQVDNPAPQAVYPVVLMSPAPQRSWPGVSRVADAVNPLARNAAAMMRLAVWQRRPAGRQL